MADTLASIGFEADIRALKQADDALRQLEQTSTKTEAATKRQDQAVDRLVTTMLEQAKTVGMSNRELLLYKAAQMGATDADKKALNAAVDKIEAYEKMTQSAAAAAAAANGAAGSMGNMRGVMGNLGYQIQDIAVQLQMGTNAMMVFGQQGSQIAAAFGPTGAVVGAFIAIGAAIGTALLPALFSAKSELEELEKISSSYADFVSVAEDGTVELGSAMKQLAAFSAEAAAEMDKLAKLKVMEEQAASIKVIKESIQDMKPFGGNLAEALGLDKASLQIVDFMAAIKELGEEVNTTTLDQFVEAIGMIDPNAKGAAAGLVDLKIKLMEQYAVLSAGLKITENTVDANTDLTDRIKELTQELALVNAEMTGGEASAARLAEAFKLGFDSVEKLPPEVSALIDKLVAAKAALKGIEEQVKRISDAEKELDEILDNATAGDDALLEVYQNRAKAAEKLMDEWSETVDYQEISTKRLVTVSEKAAERIEEAFADAWMNAFDGFESVVDGMKNAFKRLLAEMAHMALTRPIMISLGMGGMLPGTASAASGASGLSSAASGLGLLGGLGSSVMGLGGMIGGGFGAGLTASGGLLMNGSFGTMFSGAGSLLGSGNIAAGLGMAAPLIAAAVVGALGLNKITGGGLFGTSYSTTGQSLGLSLSGGDVSGSITTEESRKRSLFRGTKRRTSTSAFDTTAVDDAFDSILAAVGDAATAFGIEGADAIIKNFNASVAIDIKGKSQAEIEQAIQEWIGSTTSGIVSAVFGDSLAEFQYEGEGVIDTVNRLTLNMNSVKTMADNLGLGFDLTGRAAMAAATNIVELAGGLDNLNALTSQYYSSFYTEAEQQLNLQNKLTEAFAELNLGMPSTREGFRALVDAIDLTTEAGQAQFAALMQLVPGMDQYLTALEESTRASQEAAEAAAAEAQAKADALKAQGLDLQLRLYDALGQSAEALALRRQMELDATDETLRALLLQIYAAEDAADAARELAEAEAKLADIAKQRQSLEIELLNATGRTAEAAAAQRALELAAMDESLRALQQEIWAAYDAADAQKALAEAQAESAAKAEELLQQRQSMEIELLNATGRTAEAAAMQRAIELAAMDESLRALQEQIWAAYDAADAQKALAEAQKQAAAAARDAAQNAFGKLQDSANAEKDRLQSALDARLSAIATERQALETQRDAAIDGFQKSSQAIDDYVSKLQSINDTITGFIAETSGAVSPFTRLTQIFNEMKGGLLPDSAELGSVLGSIRSAGSSGFASATDQARAMAIAMNQAQAIGGMASDRINSARSQYDVIAESAANASAYYAEELAKLDAAAELAQAHHNEQVAVIDAQLAEAQKQLNALLGIDDRILTMSEALAEFYAALNNANNLQNSPAAQAVESAIATASIDSVAAAVVDASLNQVDAIYQSAAESVAVYVDAIYDSVAEQVDAIGRVEIAIEQLGEQVIEVNKPEDRVWIPPTMPERVMADDKDSEEVKQLLRDILLAAKSNAEHGSKSASLLQEMTIGGLDVRVEA